MPIQKKSGNLSHAPHVYIYHHHIALVARISLTLSRYSSLSFIALGRSSGQHPVSSHSCWMYVRAGRPAFARPCVGVHKSTSLMSSSLLLQQCPACLARLTWIVFVIGGRWPIYIYIYIYIYILYSLHHGITLLHKYTSMERLVCLSSCLRRTSVGHVLVSAARSDVASALEISSGLRGPCPQAFTHLPSSKELD